jgi:hypothetical protein
MDCHLVAHVVAYVFPIGIWMDENVQVYCIYVVYTICHM